MKVVLLPGDGIGREVVAVAARVLRVVAQAEGFGLDLREVPCGGQVFLETGREWAEGSFELCRDWADALLLGAVGWPGATLPTGEPAGANVLFGLRFGLDLYANVRPARLLPGVSHRVGTRRLAVWTPDEVDLVVYRENTEGLYAPIRGTLRRGGRSDLAVDSRVITRPGAERIVEAAFREAESRGAARGGARPPRVTCVDKSNVLDGCRLFREVFREAAARHPGVTTDERFIDAFCQAVLWEPASFDVVVTTNLFGDIASDVAAVLAGGLGMAPSGEVGERHGLFEPVHGSAPPLAGSGRANPLAAVLSAAMMLEWYGRRGPGREAEVRAASALERAVAALVLEGRVLPEDLGGRARCPEVAEELVRLLSVPCPEARR